MNNSCGLPGHLRIMKQNAAAIINGEPYKFYLNPDTMEVTDIETFGISDDVGNFKYLLRSLFRNKDGSDYYLPRYLDPSFVAYGLYRPLIKNGRKTMTKNPHAVALGRKGGKVKSKAKARTSG